MPRRATHRRAAQHVANTHRTRTVRDLDVVAAVWAEDDSFVAMTQASEDRSVVVKRSNRSTRRPGERLAQRDPFETSPSEPVSDEPVPEIEPEIEIEDQSSEEVENAPKQDLDALDLFGDPIKESDPPAETDTSDLFEEETMDAQPEAAADDPFDEPGDDPLPELDGGDALLEEVEEAIDQPQIEQEPLEESDPLESNDLSELFDAMREDDPDESMLFEDENDEFDLDFESDPGANEELESELIEVSPEEERNEREESEENCAEEIAKLQADRIDDIELSIRLEGNAGEDFPFECRIGTGNHLPRQWPQITYNWKAAGLCHKPLYFEQVHLERYGHSWGPYVQPIMSGVHFFGTLPILPYKMGIRTPTECVYTLGYYRPGSCAPRLFDPVPFTWRAALFQAGTATALPFTIP